MAVSLVIHNSEKGDFYDLSTREALFALNDGGKAEVQPFLKLRFSSPTHI